MLCSSPKAGKKKLSLGEVQPFCPSCTEWMSSTHKNGTSVLLSDVNVSQLKISSLQQLESCVTRYMGIVWPSQADRCLSELLSFAFVQFLNKHLIFLVWRAAIFTASESLWEKALG